ncbi:Uncharacterised protein [uncultured archaeon]|nr:Uncharacterised protein [uncultured archaeon]
MNSYLVRKGDLAIVMMAKSPEMALKGFKLYLKCEKLPQDDDIISVIPHSCGIEMDISTVKISKDK